MTSITSTRLSRAHQCLQWCSDCRKDIPASSKKDASPFTFLESVVPFDHGVFDWGIGLKAARALTKEEQLFSFPTRWAWSALSCNTDPIIGSLLRRFQGQIRQDDLIAIKLSLHKHLGHESPWFCHTQVLPETYDSVLFWTAEQLLELEGTHTYQLAVALQQQVRADYQELVGYMMHQDKEVADASNSKENGWMMFFTIENYMWALGTLYSRGHDFVRGKGNELFRCMLPGIDFLNMATPTKGANVEVRLVGNRIDLVALKDVQEGEELRVTYNKDLPNNRLLHLHGFVVSPNPLSYVPLYCELSTEAPMYKAKMAALKGIYTPGSHYFKLKLSDPIPDTLLYTLAVQRASSPNELRAMVDGVDTGSSNREGILRELVLALTQMLAGYKTTESVDEAILNEQDKESPQATAGLGVTKRRLRLATRLRYDEKQILRKGISVLMGMLRSFDSSDGESSGEEEVGDIDE